MLSRRNALKVGTTGLLIPLSRNHRGERFLTGEATPAPFGSPIVSMYRGNAARTGEMPGPAPDDRNGVDLRWQFDIKGPVTTPVVAEGMVYFGGGDDLYALSLQDGLEQWRSPLVGSFDAQPAVAAGTVFIGSSDQQVYAFDANTGDERWRFAIGRYAGSPAMADGVVLISGGPQFQTNLFALDAQNGSEIWRFFNDSASPLVPAIADGIVCISAHSAIHALDLQTGQELWRVPSQTNDSFGTEIVIANGTVFASRFEGLSAFNVQDGSERWRSNRDQFVIGTFAIMDETLVSASWEYSTVVAADAQTGDPIWRYVVDNLVPDPAKPSRYGISNVAIADDQVIATRAFNEIYGIDLRTGTERWKVTLHEGGKNVLTSPIVVDGLVVVGTSLRDVGRMYALGAT